MKSTLKKIKIMPNETVQLFEKQPIRVLWDEETEKWWFSVTDIISVLTDQADYQKTRNYWKWLKNKLKADGSEVVSHTNQLKLNAADGINPTVWTNCPHIAMITETGKLQEIKYFGKKTSFLPNFLNKTTSVAACRLTYNTLTSLPH